ncbi:MAG: hypothetical protein LBS62_06195 [Clostridiales bacterium]|nr:hypothetical protein [Clostridiales bacterium]
MNYYRLALAAAARRDISCALSYAPLMDMSDAKAAKLMEICQTELGKIPPELAELVRRREFRAVLRALRTCYKSVRVLNLEGCLLAIGGRYGSAAKCFASALARDHGNIFARDCLMEVSMRRGFFSF